MGVWQRERWETWRIQAIKRFLGRTFSPQSLGGMRFIGRCPMLVYWRAVGPEEEWSLGLLVNRIGRPARMIWQRITGEPPVPPFLLKAASLRHVQLLRSMANGRAARAHLFAASFAVESDRRG